MTFPMRISSHSSRCVLKRTSRELQLSLILALKNRGTSTTFRPQKQFGKQENKDPRGFFVAEQSFSMEEAHKRIKERTLVDTKAEEARHNRLRK
jgi:hypothetical protein